MESLERILSTTPNEASFDREEIAHCVEACVACELACVACADACLGEEEIGMLRRCIRLNLDCADICATTSRVLGRLLDPDVTLLRAQLEACARACDACAEECERHAEAHEHCRACGDECRRCEEQCRSALRELAA